MARWTALSRRFGILFVALMLTIGLLGTQGVSASNITRPPVTEPGAGQPPGICYPCFWGIKNLQQQTLFHASNFPDKSMVAMTFDFTGSAASVAYVVAPANAPNPPAPGAWWNAKIEASGHYENDQYLTKGGHYKFYVKVVDTYGNPYTQVLDFWAA